MAALMMMAGIVTGLFTQQYTLFQVYLGVWMMNFHIFPLYPQNLKISIMSYIVDVDGKPRMYKFSGIDLQGFPSTSTICN